MTNATCPIWGTPALEHPTGRDGRLIDSPRAGGKYFVTGSAEAELPSPRGYDSRFRVRLTSWLVEQHRLGNSCPEIDTETISEARQRKDLRISERTDGILRYLETKSNSLGTTVSYRSPVDAIDLEDSGNYPIGTYLGLLVHSGCSGLDELTFLLDYLGHQGLVENTGRNNPTRGCVLTVKGYERLAALDATNADSSKAFVAMWFDPSTHDAWEGGFKLAIREAGYEPMRIDQKEHVNKICDEIVAEIRRARFVVADFTHGDSGVRGGVYYEAGFAHGLDIPIIFTCRADMLKEIHFDTRQFNHITWEDPEELKEKLENRIAAVIGDGPFLN